MFSIAIKGVVLFAVLALVDFFTVALHTCAFATSGGLIVLVIGAMII